MTVLLDGCLQTLHRQDQGPFDGTLQVADGLLSDRRQQMTGCGVAACKRRKKWHTPVKQRILHMWTSFVASLSTSHCETMQWSAHQVRSKKSSRSYLPEGGLLSLTRNEVAIRKIPLCTMRVTRMLAGGVAKLWFSVQHAATPSQQRLPDWLGTTLRPLRLVQAGTHKAAELVGLLRTCVDSESAAFWNLYTALVLGPQRM